MTTDVIALPLTYGSSPSIYASLCRVLAFGVGLAGVFAVPMTQIESEWHHDGAIERWIGRAPAQALVPRLAARGTRDGPDHRSFRRRAHRQVRRQRPRRFR